MVSSVKLTLYCCPPMAQAHHDHLQSSGVSSVSRSSPLLASSAVSGLMEDGEDGQQLPGPAGGSPAHQPVETMMGMATTMAASHAVTVSSASSSSAMSGVSMGSHGISPAAAAAAAAAAAMPRGPHMQHAFQPSAAPLGSLDPNAQMNGGNMMQQQQHVRMPLQQQQQPQQQMAFHPAHQYAHHVSEPPHHCGCGHLYDCHHHLTHSLPSPHRRVCGPP